MTCKASVGIQTVGMSQVQLSKPNENKRSQTPPCPFGKAFVLHGSSLRNMGLHQNYAILVVWGLSIAMISSLYNNLHLLETEEKSPEVGVCLPMWRGN